MDWAIILAVLALLAALPGAIKDGGDLLDKWRGNTPTQEHESALPIYQSIWEQPKPRLRPGSIPPWFIGVVIALVLIIAGQALGGGGNNPVLVDSFRPSPTDVSSLPPSGIEFQFPAWLGGATPAATVERTTMPAPIP